MARPVFVVPPGHVLELDNLGPVRSQHTKNTRKYTRVITTYRSGLKIIIVSSGDGFLRYYSNLRSSP